MERTLGIFHPAVNVQVAFQAFFAGNFLESRPDILHF